MNPALILVVEDDENIRTGLVDTLESEGYRAIPAADGKEALEMFLLEPYDLVLLDIMMPRSAATTCAGASAPRNRTCR